MAAVLPDEYRDSAWELSKENVQPVKSGRNVGCITAVLQPSREDMERLMKEKQVFEEEIIAGENSEDPIKAWDSYLKWTIQNFPSGGNDLTLLNLLRKFIAKFKSDEYKNDVRYVRAWLKLAEIMKDPFETFSFMNTEGVGKECAEFYIAWADEYEKYNDMRRADRIYNDGDEQCAQPRELLQKRHMEFQLRVARGMLNNGSQSQEDDEPKSQQRAALNQISGKGKHQAVGTQRRGRAFQPLQSSGSSWGIAAAPTSQTSVGFEIYEDDQNGVSVMGETGKWASGPSGGSAKENTLNPGQWKGVKVKQKHVRSQLMTTIPAPSPMSEFTVYEDECSSSAFPNKPHRIQTNIDSILSEKKETNLDFSNIKSAIDEMPIHETNIRSGYDIDKVYTVMGEMQFEEVRAAHWRRRQKIQAEQAAIMRQQELEEERLQRARFMREQEQKVEEERRRLDSERIKFLEQEKKWIELERMQLQQKRSDLESRLKQIKILEKEAKTEEEERMLQREEEDITIQLNAVRRNIRRSLGRKDIMQCSENDASAGACAASPKNDFVIFNENNSQPEEAHGIENEMKMHQQMFASAKPTLSANNSLNHSKRSQPSPTVNTKEAMMNTKEAMSKLGFSLADGKTDFVGESQPSPTVNTKEAMSQIDEWFQKPLNDSIFGEAETGNVPMSGQQPSFSFKPIDEPASLKPLFKQNENANADPFQIFTDDDENAVERPILKKKGLAARPTAISGEYSDSHTVGSKQVYELHSHEVDKTGYCFDDVTVAGSHFAAKARMASTPFCNKTEKLQDMTQLNHLSQIQPEMTENVELYRQREQLPEPSTPYVPPGEVQEENFAPEASKDVFYTTEKQNDEDMQASNEAKQLSPIMEASNESEKSSVMGTTKSSRGDSESDKSQYPSNNIQLHSEPLKMKSFGSVLSHSPGCESPVIEAKKTDIFGFDLYLSTGSIDCNLWDDTEEKASDKERIPPQMVASMGENRPEQQSIGNATPKLETESKTSQQREVEELSSELHATSISHENEVMPSSSTLSTFQNIIPDPWSVDLLNSIMERHGRLASNSSTSIHYKNDETVPKLRKGAQLKLDGKCLRIGQTIGEGAYAKVFDVTSDEGEHSHVVKAQFPPCPWEVYAISQARLRLQKNRMNDISDCIIDINSAWFFKDASLLFMSHMNKGTLLDLVNEKKGTEKVKNVVAMWIAYQVMKIVHGLHTVGFIHGDIKPDNFMIMPVDTLELSDACSVGGIKLIDFGQAIDISEMPAGAAFTEYCPTSSFTCIQMKNKEPWNYHTDFYGIAGTLHVVLFGSYMTIKQGKDGMWEITNKIKRWYNGAFWRDFFTTLLNFPTPTEDRPIMFEDSPLPRLLSEIKGLLEQSEAEMYSVVAFLRRS